MRYEFIQKFRDAGGRFDISLIIEEGKKKEKSKKVDLTRKKAKRLTWLTKALKRGDDPVTAMPGDFLLKMFHPETLDADSATKIGIELYL